MRMTIEQMRLENFKGVRDLTINFGEKTSIFGMNGTGKTTIPDAFCWVLYNKDSHGNAPGSDNFREKPLDDSGKEIHNLDTTVELICRLDGQPFNLRRTQRENWVKKRGSVESVYQGNVSTYWINDVETKLADFKGRIAQITSEEVFRLIGSLSAFNALEWKKRRAQLLALSGIDVDAELLQRDEYRPLADECAQRGVKVEELRKIMTDQRKRTNTELTMFPVRIDEARKAIPAITDREIADAEFIVADTTQDIMRIDGMIIDARTAGSAATAGIRAERIALENELAGIKADAYCKFRDSKNKLEDEYAYASKREAYLRTDAKAKKESIAFSVRQRQMLTAERDNLRKAYSEAYEEPFVEPIIKEECPTCGQPLPPEKIEEAKATAQKEWSDRRLARLAEIKAKGSELTKRIETLGSEIEAAEEIASDIEKQAAAAAEEKDRIAGELKAYPETVQVVTPRAAEIEARLAEIERQPEAPADLKVRQLEERKAELQQIIDRNREILIKRDSMRTIKARIEELERQHREAGARVGEVEQVIALVEKFVQDRCAVLEESINSKFPTLRWKLFDIQINGGILDTCVCMIPCDSGLVSYESANTAAQVHADLEIVDVLSKHYDVSVPVFIDNAERCNTIPALNAQTITLSVSTDSELTVHTA